MLVKQLLYVLSYILPSAHSLYILYPAVAGTCMELSVVTSVMTCFGTSDESIPSDVSLVTEFL